MLPKITLWSLLALGIVFIALFFLGGSNGSLEVAGDFLDIPRFTDAFLIWVYILVGLVVLITLAVVIVEFVKNWKTDRRKAYMTLGVVCGFVLLACLCWFLGSPEKIHIVGYEMRSMNVVGFISINAAEAIRPMTVKRSIRNVCSKYGLPEKRLFNQK